MFVDGLIYVLIAVFTAIGASLNSDEAAKYISADWLFYFRSTTGWTAAGLLALKMYRSNSFAEYQREKKNGHTQFLIKSTSPEVIETKPKDT